MRDVTDELGRKIQIPQNIHRVVSLAPSITETLYALGVQDRLVGDSDYCDYPPEAKQKPHVGGTISPSIETIASLHPDVVLVNEGDQSARYGELARVAGDSVVCNGSALGGRNSYVDATARGFARRRAGGRYARNRIATANWRRHTSAWLRIRRAAFYMWCGRSR